MMTITEENLISLINLKVNQHGVVVSVTTSPKSAKRLADLGVTPNTSIKIIRKTLFHGAIEIRARGSNLILGKGVASKILVRSL